MNGNRPSMKGFVQRKNGEKYETIGEVAVWEKPTGNSQPNYPDLKGVVHLPYGELSISLWKMK